MENERKTYPNRKTKKNPKKKTKKIPEKNPHPQKNASFSVGTCLALDRTNTNDEESPSGWDD